MLRKSFVLVIIRFRVKARGNTFRFEMMDRTPGNPTTVNKLGVPPPFSRKGFWSPKASVVGKMTII
jgi:hypothetical protein